METYNKSPYSQYKNSGRGQQSHELIVRKFNARWITHAIDGDCVNFCEEVAKSMAWVSASLIRNIFGEMKRIEVKGFENCRTDFYLLRPKVAYIVARNQNKNEAELFAKVYNKMADNVHDNAGFCNLVRMTEAIVAYHKTYSKKD